MVEMREFWWQVTSFYTNRFSSWWHTVHNYILGKDTLCFVAIYTYCLNVFAITANCISCVN